MRSFLLIPQKKSIVIVIFAFFLMGAVWILSSSHMDRKFSANWTESEKVKLTDTIDFNQTEIDLRVFDQFEGFNIFQKNKQSPFINDIIKENIFKIRLPVSTERRVSILHIDNSILFEAEILVPLIINNDLIYRSYDMIDNITSIYIELPDQISFTDFVYIKTKQIPYEYSIYLEEKVAYFHYKNIELYYLVVNIGIIFTMIVINIFISIQLKEKLYFLHSLFLLSCLHYIMSINGLFKLFGIIYSIKGYSFWVSSIYLSTTIFIYYLLGLNNQSKVHKTIFGFLIILCCSTFPSIYFIDNDQSIFILLSSIGIVLFIILISFSLFVHIKFQRISIYYLSALFILAGGVFITILDRFHLLPRTVYVENVIIYCVSLEAFLFTMSLTEIIRMAKSKISDLKRVSTIDNLTKLYNRNYFDHIYENLKNYSIRYNENISIIMIDLDHFKKINDTLGHSKGDMVLRETAQLIRTTLRSSDIPFRWGGEEFLLILRETNIGGAINIAEKIRANIKSCEYGGFCKVTASLGVVEISRNETFEKWFNRADFVLYKAKKNGRDQVVPCFGCLSLEGQSFHRLKWEPYFECGHPLLDEQHKTLFEKINRFLMAFHTNQKLESLLEDFDELVDHVELHFRDEEKILGDYGFEHLESHSAIHKKLKNAALDFRSELSHGKINSQDIFSLLYGDIIMGHLVSEDFKFFSYFNDMKA